MISEGTDWLSAIGILLSGLVLGTMFIYTFVRRKQTAAANAAPIADLEVKELEAKRDALIRQLRELEDAGIAGAERTRLELQTAEVLRSIDSYKRTRKRPARPVAGAGGAAAPLLPTDEKAPTGLFVRNPALKGFLWGIGSVIAVGAIGFYVYTSATPRGQEGVTGGAPMQQAPAQAGAQQRQAPDPAVQQLEAAVKSNPDNVDARINLARAYLDRENLMGVFEQTKAVLEKNPKEPRAQTYNAIVRMSMGQIGPAKKMLESATGTDPKLTDAWVALAWINVQQGSKDEASKAIQSAIKAHPEQEARLTQVFQQMQSQVHAPGAAGTSQASTLPEGHPGADATGAPDAAGGAMQVPPAPPADPASAIHLTLTMDASSQKSRTGVIYIIAREAGQTSGVPVAVKRIPAGSFPLNVDFSSADSMMGQPLPKKIHLEARLDSDGDAATRSPNDAVAVADNVAAGAKLTLVLK